MTFKHAKFEDSAVMRSLEKLAREKGLVEPEKITKTASSKVQLTPTSALMENVLNLCAGLRQAGFHKHAEELEEKFVAYKQAQTMYETSKETGEDLVDRAHPKGSHHLENVDSDEAVVETIVDKHLKNLKMIEKEPTGKLASSKSILNAVKIVLAQGTDETKKVLDQLSAQMAKLRASVNAVKNKADTELTFSIDRTVNNIIEESQNPTIDNLESIKSSLTNLGRRLQPGTAWQYATSYGFGGLSKDTWSVVSGSLRAAQDAVNEGLKLRNSYNELVSAGLVKEQDKAVQPPQEKPPTDPTLEKIKAARSSLNGIIGLVKADSGADPQDVRDINGWIAKVDAALKNLESTYSSMSPQDAEAALAKITKDFARVRQEWA